MQLVTDQQAAQASDFIQAKLRDLNRRGSALIVDDNVNDRKLMAQTLKDYSDERNLNLFIAEAADGIEAMELLKHQKFDIIFMDIKMPRMDAYQFMDKFINGTPVVFVTGAIPSSDDIVKALRRGIITIMEKPATINALQSVMGR